jgi:hypothetical protein
LFGNNATFPSLSLLGALLSKTGPEYPPSPLRSLFPDDSTDSEDQADELDEFFIFMVWNDFSEEVKKKNQVLLKMRSGDVLSLLRTSACDDFDDIIYLKHPTPA